MSKGKIIQEYETSWKTWNVKLKTKKKELRAMNKLIKLQTKKTETKTITSIIKKI